MKTKIIDDVPVNLDDLRFANIDEEDEDEALRYSLGLGRRYEEEQALALDDEE